MKGIILAGGSGTRLYPATIAVSKQILPVYDKPMIYYPLSILMLAGIQDILIISTPRDIKVFEELFKDGSKLGLNISYKVQNAPKGLAEAFILGKDFIGNDSVALILGDNIFYGQNLIKVLERASARRDEATIFGYYVKDPKSYGVIEFDKKGKVLSIEEKPQNPKSNYAVPGLYFYTNEVVEIAQTIKPSPRGELEITDVNIEFMKRNKLNVETFGRGMAWFDTGTHAGLLEASNFVESIQERQGLYIACLEEIAYNKKFITKEQLMEIGRSMDKTEYGQYILNLRK